jgi:hypothetical protein
VGGGGEGREMNLENIHVMEFGWPSMLIKKWNLLNLKFVYLILKFLQMEFAKIWSVFVLRKILREEIILKIYFITKTQDIRSEHQSER